MRVSVIVPLFNKATLVKRCLDSIAAQTLSDFEVIVVDDGSTDGGAAIAQGYADSRFRVIRQANAGPGPARNAGARAATAAYVAFLDADDAWRPEFLERCAAILDAYSSAVAVSTAWTDFPEGVPTTDFWTARGIREGLHRISPATSGRLFDVMVRFMWTGSTMVRRKDVLRWGGFLEGGCRFAEDAVLFLKLLLNNPVFFHLEPLADFHREASVLSGNYDGPRALEPFLTDPDCLQRECPPELRHLLDEFYVRRACKAACMLSYWGDWRAARSLLRRFVTVRHCRMPLVAAALLGGTPAGAIAGAIYRRLGLRRPAAGAFHRAWQRTLHREKCR